MDKILKYKTSFDITTLVEINKDKVFKDIDKKLNNNKEFVLGYITKTNYVYNVIIEYLSETLQNLLEATDTDYIMLSNGKKIVNKESKSFNSLNKDYIYEKLQEYIDTTKPKTTNGLAETLTNKIIDDRVSKVKYTLKIVK